MKLQPYPEVGKKVTVDLPSSTLREMYRQMLRIRRFEEKLVELYPVQDMRTPVHLCLGQEAVAVGVCLNLKKEDYMCSNHRGHGHCIAKGTDMKSMMAEFYGRKTGCSRGRGGSMHLVDPERGILGTSAIVGGGLPIAVGTALASSLRKDGRISVVFFGDGAVDEGVFHESLNFASFKKLPVFFVCENNFYATNSHQSARQPTDNIVGLAKGYSIPSERVNGNDVTAVFKAARDAVKRVRSGEGPMFLECRTYRWKGHVGPDCDVEKGCRPREELERWVRRCPVKSFEELLLNENVMSKSEIDQVAKQVDEEIEAAVSFGRNSPFPDKDELMDHVY
ncbi:MAG: thiamine pyrophosphate-dependent dehydrogenase E1 component subunit alpha [Candidatus Brocadiales bacterium]